MSVPAWCDVDTHVSWAVHAHFNAPFNEVALVLEIPLGLSAWENSSTTAWARGISRSRRRSDAGVRKVD